MELIEALRLQLEWGADEALLEAAQDRRFFAPAPARPPEMAPKPVRAPRAPATLLVGPAEAAGLAEGCETLEALQRALAGFTGCALRDTATQLVFADGPADARLMLVGEAPGAEEDRTGRPFVGQAGQLLDKMLSSIGLERAQVRIANVVPWRPPGDRSPTESEIALCRPFLLRHIALLRPQRLVLLGAVAAKAVLPEPERHLGVRRLRGVWRDAQIPGLEAPLPCLATYHPAYLLRMPLAKAEAWRDLLTLRETLESGL